MPNNYEGTQFFTRVLVGDDPVQCMLDGGYAVNSITEDMVVDILNKHQSAGMCLSDSRHPVMQLERWPEKEGVRGVAGGKVVPLIGAVVLRLKCAKRARTSVLILKPDLKFQRKEPRIGLI